MKLNRRVIATGILLLAGALGITGCRTASLDPVELGLTRIAGERPDHYPVHGIDISKYQGDVDWRAARADGVEFVYIKATEGGDRLDERFHENWRGARDAGIPHGAYHFFYWLSLIHI